MRRSTVQEIDAGKIALGDFRQAHIALARAEFAFVSRGNPSWANAGRQIFTDGRFGKPLERINIFGKVEWGAESMKEAVEALWLDLVKRSSRGSGIGLDEDYLRSLTMWVADTGSLVNSVSAIPDNVKEVHFFPNVPYARKVEMGQSAKARTGVFTPAYRKAKSAFGKSVRIFFDYTVPKGSATVVRTNGRTARQDGLPVPRIRMIQGGAFQ